MENKYSKTTEAKIILNMNLKLGKWKNKLCMLLMHFHDKVFQDTFPKYSNNNKDKFSTYFLECVTQNWAVLTFSRHWQAHLTCNTNKTCPSINIVFELFECMQKFAILHFLLKSASINIWSKWSVLLEQLFQIFDVFHSSRTTGHLIPDKWLHIPPQRFVVSGQNTRSWRLVLNKYINTGKNAHILDGLAKGARAMIYAMSNREVCHY